MIIRGQTRQPPVVKRAGADRTADRTRRQDGRWWWNRPSTGAAGGFDETKRMGWAQEELHEEEGAKRETRRDEQDEHSRRRTVSSLGARRGGARRWKTQKALENALGSRHRWLRWDDVRREKTLTRRKSQKTRTFNACPARQSCCVDFLQHLCFFFSFISPSSRIMGLGGRFSLDEKDGDLVSPHPSSGVGRVWWEYEV